MPLTPEAHQALYADEAGASLEMQLEAALARNVAGGLAVAETTSLASVAAAAVAEVDATSSGDEKLTGLSDNFQDILRNVTGHEVALFSGLDLEVPSPRAFAEAGGNDAAGEDEDHSALPHDRRIPPCERGRHDGYPADHSRP